MNNPQHVIAHMLLVEHASAEVVRALRQGGIRSIVIKGPLQQQWLASSGRPRASVDVDLLLDPTDIGRASAVLTELGYCVEPEVTPGVEHHAALLTAPWRVPVELHWTLWGTDPASTWPVLVLRTEEADLGGVAVEIPDEAARCLLVALHAAHHGLGEEAPRHDLARAIAVGGRSTWEDASELASAVGGLPAFVAGLELVPAGAQLRAELELPSLPLTERLALNIGAAHLSGAPGFYWLARQQGMRAKASFVVHKLVPPADFMRFKYPYARKGTVQLALMYLYRPLWIARWALPGFLAWSRARIAAKKSRKTSDQG